MAPPDGSEDRKSASRPAAPAGLRLYAIGDVHGQAEMLDALLWRIGQDFAAAPEPTRRLIFLGDYVDRGPDSAGVLSRLLRLRETDIDCVMLKGNHEDQMIRFLDDGNASAGVTWLGNGGAETMVSYGVDVMDLLSRGAAIEDLRGHCLDAIPADHRAFLRALPTEERVGDYLFVHAGVRPGVPLDAQRDVDRLWIRKAFLEHEGPFPMFVVHGHTPVLEPDIRANRLGIDTGAGFGRRLTAVALWGTERRFLSVGNPVPPGGF